MGLKFLPAVSEQELRERVRQCVPVPVYSGCLAWYCYFHLSLKRGIQSVEVSVKIPLYSVFVVIAMFPRV